MVLLTKLVKFMFETLIWCFVLLYLHIYRVPVVLDYLILENHVFIYTHSFYQLDISITNLKFRVIKNPITSHL